MGSTPEPAIRSGDVILVSGYSVLTAFNWSQHWCAISAPKLARKYEIDNWFPCGADGRAVYGHVITRIFWDGWIYLAAGLRARGPPLSFLFIRVKISSPLHAKDKGLILRLEPTYNFSFHNWPINIHRSPSFDRLLTSRKAATKTAHRANACLSNMQIFLNVRYGPGESAPFYHRLCWFALLNYYSKIFWKIWQAWLTLSTKRVLAFVKYKKEDL